MDFKIHLERAWHLTIGTLVPLILMTLLWSVLSFISLGVLAPVVTAGYFQSVLQLIRNGREPQVQDLFSEMRLFLPLLGFGVGVFVLTMIGFSLFFLPGVVIVCGITFVCLYMFPLMTDRSYGLVDAIKESTRMVTGDDVMDHVITALLFIAITAVGSSVFIGWIFTQPLATIFLLSVYEQKVTGTAPPPQASGGSPPPPPSSGDADSGEGLKQKM
jgi:uncharacterized membrane protein